MTSDTRDPAPFVSTIAVIVTCQCGRISEYANGMLQRLHRIASDTLLYDLQFRLRCSHCHRRQGFKIAIQERRFVGTSSRLPEPRVIVDSTRE